MLFSWGWEGNHKVYYFFDVRSLGGQIHHFYIFILVKVLYKQRKTFDNVCCKTNISLNMDL